MEVVTLLAVTLSTLLVWGVFYMVNGRKLKPLPRQREMIPPEAAPSVDTAAQAQAVGEFYDSASHAFLKVYGDVIQAFRTHDLGNLLGYQATVMQLRPGMKLLDAGCGVCGPAIYFAQHHEVSIDAITASAVQRQEAMRRIQASGLQDRIHVVQGDYHRLSQHFQAGTYDVVYFLESFGHSPEKATALAAAWDMLKPGGTLYIKDLFIKEAALPAHAGEIKQNVHRINTAYRYNVGDLNAVLTAIRRKGFILSALKTIDIPLEDFENLTISNAFQDLTGIHRIDDLQAYLFPVDFFELVCIKPWYDLHNGNSRYFLQNLYYLKVLGKAEQEL